MKTLTRGLLVLFFVTTSIVTGSSQAAVYEVNRSFTDGFSTATLTGTVDVPLGHYVIQNTTPNPFTAVNLTLTVNATPYNLTNALTDLIGGTGQFTIDATPATLTFTANGDLFNPADLVFSDNTDTQAFNKYGIGSNGNPAFEVAQAVSGSVITGVSFPTVFGIVVPEPASLTLFSLAMAGLGLRRRH